MELLVLIIHIFIAQCIVIFGEWWSSITVCVLSDRPPGFHSVFFNDQFDQG